jgi:phenylacetate-CoA ligase
MTNKDFIKLEELRALQLDRLQNIVQKAYDNVELFRTRLDDVSLKPADIKSLKDIEKLPFTAKSDLQENYPYGLLASSNEELIRLQASGGIVAGYTKEDIEMWTNAMERCLLCAGVNKNDIIQNSGGLGVHYGVEALGAAIVPTEGNSSKGQIKIMKDLGVTGVCCTPSYFNFIVEQAGEIDIDLRDLPLRIGIFGSELWTEEMRSRIEESSGIKAYDIYGLAEIISPGVGIECECRNGLHILEDLFYPEIIDRETGEVLPDGELGELVLTTLDKQAMPLIRYCTGDITRIISGDCKCGRTLVRIERISTRSDDMLTIQGIKIFPSQIEAALLSIEGTLPHYNIILDSENGMDSIEVNVEITEAIFSDRVRSLEAFQHNLIDAIENVLGLRVKLKLVAPGAIQRSEGKAKRVIDHRNR